MTISSRGNGRPTGCFNGTTGPATADHATLEELKRIKRRLGPKLTAMGNINGIGITWAMLESPALSVNLTTESDETRRDVLALILREAPGVKVVFSVVDKVVAEET